MYKPQAMLQQTLLINSIADEMLMHLQHIINSTSMYLPHVHWSHTQSDHINIHMLITYT